MRLFYQKFTVLALLTIILSGFLSTSTNAQVLFNEGFNVVAPLPAGWAAQNLSVAGGTTGWFQGNAGVFPANSGATTAYIAANFQNTTGANTISNWLFCPNVTLKNGDIFTFYTRTTTGQAFPDRLQVRMSTNGASVNAGATETSVGDFTTLLLDINPTYLLTVYPEVWTQYTITIAGLGGPTSGRLAFRYFVEDGGPAGNNSDYIGIDDAVYTSFAAPCSGTPNPGNTLSTAVTTCPGVPFTLSLQNNPAASGLTYQWQSAAALAGPYSNIGGATQFTLTTTQAVATYYQCNVTCAGNTAASVPLLEPMSPPSGCYCTSSAQLAADEDILNVTLGTLNNTSTCASVGTGFGSVVNLYSNYTSGAGAPAAPNLVLGATMPMSVQVGTCGGNFTNSVAAWIDFNQNGAFEAAEKVFVSPGGTVGPHTETRNIVIPAGALLGTTRMRVVCVETGAPNGILPCGTYLWGETEDYNVTMIPCVQGTIGTQPSDATIRCGDNITFTVAATGSVLTYQWEQRVSAAAPWTNVTNGGVFLGATTSSLAINNAPITMNGYQYRLLISGACTAIFVSNTVTLTVNPFLPNVVPASATLCNGGIQQFSTAPPTVSYNLCSGPLAISVPDNVATGASTTLNVAGIPAGAFITSVAVTINMNHTYCGDMLFNLQAPNGQILALDKYLTATGNQAGPYPNTGFLNCIISSAGVNALSTANAQPITGTFKPDAINTPIGGPTVQNPAGFVSNAANFAALYSIPNGTWTLAMADGGPGDVGVLTSWCITIVYQSGPPATAIWSPVTGLFNDAAVTIPYTGTAVSTIWAAPIVTTTYSLVVSTPTCTSNATVLVTVNNPVAITTQPVSTATCNGGNASFSVAASGGTIGYQWQVSTDGTTWTNVANAGVYSGATTNTLNLTGVTVSPYNGYQYRAVLTVPSCNSVTSTAATLTVNQNPAPTITATLTQLYPGLTTTLSTGTMSSYQWYKDGVAIPAPEGIAQSLHLDIDGLGSYTVSVVDGNGCSGSSAATSIIAIPNDMMFIYPSPNTGSFQVRYQSFTGNTPLPRNITIFDSKGARVFTKTYNITAPYGRMDVDMTNHGRGVYRVELSDRSGNRIKTGSVLIL